MLRTDYIKLRARPRPHRPRGAFRPCAQEHAGAGDHHHRTAARRDHRLRHHHRDGVPMAGHGPPLHPGGQLRRRAGDGGVPLPDRASSSWSSTWRSISSTMRSTRACACSPYDQSHRAYPRLSRRAARPAARHPRASRARLPGEPHRHAGRRKAGALGHRGAPRPGKTGVVGRSRKRGSGRARRPARRHGRLPMHEATASRTQSRTTGACTLAATTATPPCCSAPPATSPRRATSTARCISIFQPAEEGGGGGQVMVKEGLFDRFPADEIYALHNWPDYRPARWRFVPAP